MVFKELEVLEVKKNMSSSLESDSNELEEEEISIESLEASRKMKRRERKCLKRKRERLRTLLELKDYGVGYVLPAKVLYWLGSGL